MRKRFALISVNDKTGLGDFVKDLDLLGFSFVASKVCARILKKWRVNVKEASKITGYPPVMGKQGIKLMHPKIFGGILADRKKARHRADMKKYGINPFDLVVCNFYPFEKITATRGHLFRKAIENIDIGGPAMVRCAAKNYANVTVVTDPRDYTRIISELKENKKVCLKTREELALKAFKKTREYDTAIISYLSSMFTL
jgi:phosphoribosylaminoimidazolecarboxamide formyltransferase/IMP cyclohydrolase